MRTCTRSRTRRNEAAAQVRECNAAARRAAAVRGPRFETRAGRGAASDGTQRQWQVERTKLALADDHLALDRELPLRRALRFWADGVDKAMEGMGLTPLADVPVRLLSAGQAKRATLARV